MKEKIKINYLILSDLHLSSPVSRSDKALEILDQYDPSTLIINGDLIDSEHLKRLKKHDWAFLSKLRKLSKTHKVVVIKGNHDGKILDFIGELIGLDIVDNYDIEMGETKYHVVHGDRFDNWIRERPIISELASSIHYLFQKMGGKKQRVALFLKHTTKKFLRCTDKVKRTAIDFCKKNYYNGIIVGHTHFYEYEKIDDLEYWNSGCFAEADGKNSYITINRLNQIEIKFI
jgi:UDP-2,3-diacylglucosamine pyrophosphatase LpxH